MSQYQMVKVSDVPARMQSGGVMVDVRAPGEYAGSHVTGAVLHPLSSLDPGRVRELSKGRPLYVMCQGGVRAARAADQLCAAGLTDIFVIDGGMNAWESAGLPVERGERSVLPIERQARLCMGAFALLGSVLAYFVHPAWAGLSAFAGAGLMYSAITNWCGLGLVLAKMPWNQASGEGACCGSKTCGGN